MFLNVDLQHRLNFYFEFFPTKNTKIKKKVDDIEEETEK